MGQQPTLSPEGSQSGSAGAPADKPGTSAGKPIVHYDRGYDNYYIVVGAHAYVHALDHPLCGADDVTTSRVLEFDPKTGNFETLNTLYMPGEASETV